MTDEIDKLRAAMEAATPKPARKADTLARAMESFDAHQEMGDPARPMSDRRPTGRLWQGVKNMFGVMTTRGGIATTTALVAVGLVAVLPVDFASLTGANLEHPILVETEASVAEPMLDMELAETDSLAVSPAAPMAARQGANVGQAIGQLSQSARILTDDAVVLPEPSTEAFANQQPSALKITTEDPVATFSADVDTASYGVVR
ncbi:MAG: von Willebrand factor type A domain-containing protein, partial [Pseudomonadota bacterium]